MEVHILKNETELSTLAERLIDGLRTRKLSEGTIANYKKALNRIIKFASNKGKNAYYHELSEEYADHLNQCLETGETTKNVWVFDTRALKLFVSLAETGVIDFSRKPIEQHAYSLPPQGEKLAQDILEYSDIKGRKFRENISLVRHVLWYAKENGYAFSELNDEVLLDFIIEEAPTTNRGTMSRVMMIVRCIAKYFCDHDLGNIQYAYENLKVKGGDRKLFPSYKPEEVKAMIDCLETDNPIDRRNRAMILLSYATGLRGIDVIRLKLKNINFRKEHLTINQSKTGVSMLVKVPAIALNALADYILNYRPKLDSDFVFITGKSEYKEMERGLTWMITAVEKRAGIQHLPFRGFHGLRRSFAISLASAEVPLETLSKMLGHISPSSDRPYLSFNRKEIEFVAMDFRDVPIESKIYKSLLNLNN